MKAIHKYIAFATLALSAAACSQDDDFAPSYFSDPDAVRITAQVGTNDVTGGFTRSNPLGTAEEQAQFNLGDQISVTAGTQVPVTYQLGTDGWKPVGETYLKWQTNEMAVTAYYPVGKNDASATTFTVPIEYTEDKPIADADYMTYSGTQTKGDDKSINLAMQRKMVRMVITPKLNNQFPTGYSVTAIKVHANTKGYADGEAVAGDIQVSAYKHTDGVFYALLAPTTEAIAATFLTVTVSDGTNSQDLTLIDIPATTAGNSYSFTLTVGKDMVTMGTVSVDDWNGATIDGGMAEEVKVETVIEGSTATITIPELATAAMVQNAISDLSVDITTVNIYGSLTESQQNAVAAALAGKTISLYLPDMETSELSTALANKEDNISVSCGCIVEDGTYIVYNAEGLSAWGEAARAVISTGTEDTNNDWYAEYTTDMPNLTLAADITLTGENNWTPLGYCVEGDSKDTYYPYIGTIDGNGHTITGLNINSTEDYIAFVGSLGPNSEVKNLTFKDATIVGGECVATVAADCGGNVTNCHVTGSSSVSGNYCAAGVVASNIGGIISGCTNAAAVTVTAGDVNAGSGGVVGSNANGIVMGCFNSGDITASASNGSHFYGGVVGFNYAESTIIACGNTGKVVASANGVGGIVGANYSVPVYACWTKETTELRYGGEVSSKDGVGIDLDIRNAGVLKACYSFANASAVADAITAMNTVIEEYNASAAEGRKCTYKWQVGTDGYPTLVATATE